MVLFKSYRGTARNIVGAMVVIASISLIGCGGVDSRTPVQLASEIVAALKNNDHAAYAKLCFTLDQMLATFDAMVASGQLPKERVAEADEFRAMLRSTFPDEFEAPLKANFQDTAKAIDWNNVQATSVKADIRSEQGTNVCKLSIELSNGRTLIVDGMVKSPEGWRIGESRPLRLTHPDGEQQHSAGCAANLHMALISIRQYTAEHQGYLPVTLPLQASPTANDRKLLSCPKGGSAYVYLLDHARQTKVPLPPDVGEGEGKSSGVNSRRLSPGPSTIVILWDSEPRHGGMRNVAFLDCHIELLDEAAFQEALKKSLEAVRVK